MEAPKERLSKVLSDFSGKLGRVLAKDRANVRAAFDSAVTEASDVKGLCDGAKLLELLSKVRDACPEGPVRDAAGGLVDRIHQERSYRGEIWCRDSLLVTLREGVADFGEKLPEALDMPTLKEKGAKQHESPPAKS